MWVLLDVGTLKYGIQFNKIYENLSFVSKVVRKEADA
jgi:hypothetical protein